jgi:hypothetical protein
MFSLFQEKPSEDPSSNSKTVPPQETSPETPPEAHYEYAPSQEHPALRTLRALVEKLRASVPDGGRFNPLTIMLALALFVALVYGIHERNVAAHVSSQQNSGAQPGDTATPRAAQKQSEPLPGQAQSPEQAQLAAQIAAQMKDTRAQIDALNAKLDSLSAARQPSSPAKKPPAPAVHRNVIQPTGNRQKPDPRWKMMQSQIDSQGKQIDAQGKQIESTRQEIVSTRTDLQGSIAKTHEELVVLQKKGERNYYEFDLDKSKNFHSAGPVGVSLRKANTKHQYADLELLVDDRQVSKKHLNLYEPVVFYPSDERQPVELVINSITKNHIHGYLSAPRYKTAELTASGDTQDSSAKPRSHLVAPR